MVKGIKLYVVEAQNVTLVGGSQTREHHIWVDVHSVRIVYLKDAMMVNTLILMKLQAQKNISLCEIVGGANLF